METTLSKTNIQKQYIFQVKVVSYRNLRGKYCWFSRYSWAWTCKSSVFPRKTLSLTFLGITCFLVPGPINYRWRSRIMSPTYPQLLWEHTIWERARRRYINWLFSLLTLAWSMLGKCPLCLGRLLIYVSSCP